MARAISAHEAKKLRDKSKKSLSDISAALAAGEQNREKIAAAAKALALEQAAQP